MSKNLLNPAPAAEPLRAVGTGTGAVAAVLALFLAFGGHLTQDQTTAILGAAAVLGPLVVAEVGRLRVYSPATVKRLTAPTLGGSVTGLPNLADLAAKAASMKKLPPPASATEAAEPAPEVPPAAPAAQSASMAATEPSA